MYKVIEIIEPDFGCEGVPDGQKPMCNVIIQSQNGEKISLSVPDRELYQKNIIEGSTVNYTNGIISAV